MHHGRETWPAELRSICLAGKTGTADKKVPPDGGDWVSCTRHEGEFRLLCHWEVVGGGYPSLCALRYAYHRSL